MENIASSIEPVLEKQLKGHRNSITSLKYSPNKQQIASSSLDNSVLLWDLRGTMRSYRFQGHDEAVMDVTFSPSGKYMASASRDKTVRLWVPTVTGSTGMFKAHSQTVRSVQFSSDGSKIITASDDKIIKLWSAEKQKFVASFVGHTNWVRCARMCSDDSVIASCSDDKTTKLWNPDSGECIHTYKDQKGYGVNLAWHPSGCYIAVGTSQGNVKLYDIRTHSLVQYYSIHNEAVTQLDFHPSGSYILTASKDGKMKILDLLEGHPLFTLSGHTGAVNAATFSPNGDAFASGGDDKLVVIWKTNFTELGSEVKENIVDNQTPVLQSVSQTSKGTSVQRKQKDIRNWYLCYHSTKYPVITFVHLDDNAESERVTTFEEPPNANSTIISQPRSNSNRRQQDDIIASSTPHNQSKNMSTHFGNMSPDLSSYSVGDISHIPRLEPKPGTYTIPSISFNRSVATEFHDNEDIFGLIKLKEDDVCYTSGIIEWVGRKRSFPVNSGFKVLNGNKSYGHHEPQIKKIRKLNKTFSVSTVDAKECDCANVLPTVNAIVDHLNALHEAVDIVDLRLNNLEDSINL